MNNQALFSSKDKSKKLKCRLLQFLFGALRVKYTLQLLSSKVITIKLIGFRRAHVANLFGSSLLIMSVDIKQKIILRKVTFLLQREIAIDKSSNITFSS